MRTRLKRGWGSKRMRYIGVAVDAEFFPLFCSTSHTRVTSSRAIRHHAAAGPSLRVETRRRSLSEPSYTAYVYDTLIATQLTHTHCVSLQALANSFWAFCACWLRIYICIQGNSAARYSTSSLQRRRDVRRRIRQGRKATEREKHGQVHQPATHRRL